MPTLNSPVIPFAPTDEASPAWRYSYGTKPYVVAAYERPDRDGEVWLRWSNPAKPGRDKREYLPLKLTVRLPDTTLDPNRVRQAERAVHEKHALLKRQHRGTLSLVTSEPHAPQVPAPPVAPTTSPSKGTPTPSPLTLREGFRRALQPKHGKYFSTTSRRYRDMVAMTKRLFGDVRKGIEQLINPDMSWDTFGPAAIRELRREMARRYLASNGRQFGMRKAEVLIDAIYTVAAFLRQEGHIAPTAAVPLDKWRDTLRLEWTEETGQRRTRKQPRHTPAEYRKIFAALTDERVDPRIATAIEWAGELRTGQVLVCMRTMLDLPEVDPSRYDFMPAGSLGSIDVPGEGKKCGELVMFTPEQRRAADRALCGYLSKYEAAYQARVIADYPLFPGARMRRSRKDSAPRQPCRLRAHVKPMNRTGARIAFHELERIAGVKVIHGRAWYGLRRVATDMAEKFTQDERVKNAMGGWRESETRRRIYQDHESEEVRAMAADVRRRMRTGKGMVLPEDSAAAAGTTTTPIGAAQATEQTTPEHRILARLFSRRPITPKDQVSNSGIGTGGGALAGASTQSSRRHSETAPTAPVPSAPTRVGAVGAAVGAYRPLLGTTETQAGPKSTETTTSKVGATGFEPATSCSRSAS
jgi:hypothetical protein